MKKTLSYFLVFCLLFSITGCALFKNPFKDWTKAEDKTVKIQQKIDTNADLTINKAKEYVYAAKITLEADSSTNKYHTLETEFVDRASLILGQPSLSDSLTLRIMVSDLLSTNAQIIAQGKKELGQLDKQVIQLQNENDSLQNKLSQAENKLIKVASTNAGLAQNWSNLTKIFWYVVYFIIAGIIIKILSVVLPSPYSNIIYLISLPIGFVFHLFTKIVPEIKSVAKVVDEKYLTSTTQLVQAVQTIKENNPSLHSSISSIVDNATNEASTSAINQVKTTLNMTS